MIRYTLFDIATLIIYLIVIFCLAYFYSKKKVKKDSRYRYYFPALIFKIFAGISFAIIYNSYYKGGDTFVYFDISHKAFQAIFHHPLNALQFLFSSHTSFPLHKIGFTQNFAWFLNAPGTYNAVRFTILFVFLGLGSYFNATILISWLSFVAIWKFYLAVSEWLNRKDIYLVIFCLFIPSVSLWSGAVLKDSYTMMCTLFILYGFYRLLTYNRLILKYILLIIASAIVIKLIKPYILYIFFPLCLLWVYWVTKKNIRSKAVRYLIAPFLLLLLVGALYLTFNVISEGAGKYSLDNLQQTLEGFQSWHTYLAVHRDESGYTLGAMNYSFWGMLLKTPAALFVTFFRPYIWKANSATMLLGALESSAYFILFIVVVIRKFKFIIYSIYRNPTIRFFFLFSLLFGFTVGISSYNFGALSRYKIPCMPFFSILIYVWFFLKKENLNSLINEGRKK